LSFLYFLISFIGIVGLRITIIVIAIGIALLSEDYNGKSRLLEGWIIGLFVGGILMIVLERLYPYLEKLDVYTKTFKSYPYTEKYGRNYLQPKPEDFGITQAEFKEYNSRFQFEYIKLFFSYGILIVTCIYVLQGKISGIQGILLIGGAATIAIILNYLFQYWNKKISKRHRYYNKIYEFQEAFNIYLKIRDENSNI
jgi:small-conductance mechanosensitive channel